MEKQREALELRYGTNGRCDISISGSLTDHRSCGGQEVEDLRSAIFSALSAPVEFPPMEQSIVEGDRVVIAVDPSVPRLAEIVAGVVEYLVERDFDASLLRIVVAGKDQLLRAAIVRALGVVSDVPIEVELHDADDSTKIAYVAANEAAEPIYMNRSMVDAEVVIPITCARGHDALDYFGAYTLFPRLSDRRTRGQFLNLARLEVADQHAELRTWADQAAWWVGLCIAVQVVPGSEGGVVSVRAGSPLALEAAVQRDMEIAWTTGVDDSSELVLAVVDGDRFQQTWDNIARAIHGALRAVTRGGTIVVCSQLSEHPGRALKKLQDPNRSAGTLAKQLSHDSADDALPAAVILGALRDCHVYLLSELDVGTIEELGMGAIETPEQLEHLIAQHESCLILGSAQHRLVRCST